MNGTFKIHIESNFVKRNITRKIIPKTTRYHCNQILMGFRKSAFTLGAMQKVRYSMIHEGVFLACATIFFANTVNVFIRLADAGGCVVNKDTAISSFTLQPYRKGFNNRPNYVWTWSKTLQKCCLAESSIGWMFSDLTLYPQFFSVNILYRCLFNMCTLPLYIASNSFVLLTSITSTLETAG